MSTRYKIFTDFDGTITTVDTADILVDYSIGRHQRKAIDRQMSTGKISFKAGMTRQFSGVHLDWDEVYSRLAETGRVDTTFPDFVAWVEARNIEMIILSSGFEQFIRAYLQPLGLDYLEVRANQIAIENKTCALTFYDDTPYGHDKAASLHAAHAAGFQTIYLGDGISDFDAAQTAGILFAKHGEQLAEYCDEQGLAYHRFHNFNDVIDVLITEYAFTAQVSPT